MFSRSALRSLLNVERAAGQQFQYASRACLHQASTTSGPRDFHATPSDLPPPPPSAAAASAISQSAQSSTPSDLHQASSAASPSPSSETFSAEPILVNESQIPRSKLPLPPLFDSKLKITKSLAEKLPYLQSQRPHYISAHLHDRPYLLTEGDHLRLPFLMPQVKSGDILRFNRASAIGSREYTLKGAPYIDERLFECRLRVLGVESEPLRIKEKTKRRQRHVQHVKSKHKYTILRVMQVKVKSLEELKEEGAEIVQEGTIMEEGVDVIEKKSQDDLSSST